VSKSSVSKNSGSESRVCNVCHLPYTGDECLVCKAEREHAASVIQERGRRHGWDKRSDPDNE